MRKIRRKLNRFNSVQSCVTYSLYTVQSRPSTHGLWVFGAPPNIIITYTLTLSLLKCVQKKAIQLPFGFPDSIQFTHVSEYICLCLCLCIFVFVQGCDRKCYKNTQIVWHFIEMANSICPFRRRPSFECRHISMGRNENRIVCLPILIANTWHWCVSSIYLCTYISAPVSLSFVPSTVVFTFSPPGPCAIGHFVQTHSPSTYAAR